MIDTSTLYVLYNDIYTKKLLAASDNNYKQTHTSHTENQYIRCGTLTVNDDDDDGSAIYQGD